MSGENVDIKVGQEADVHVTYLNTNASVRFYVPWETPLAKAWEIAYEKLGEARREKDQLECVDGHSVMDYLSLTMQELKERGICPERRFQIKCEAGGA